MTQTRPCPLCRTEQIARSRPVRHGYSLVDCASCGLTRLSPMPAPAALQAIYAEDYFADVGEVHGYRDYQALRPGIEHSYRRRLRRIAAAMQNYAAPARRIHEIGPGLGYGLPLAQEIFPGAAISASDISPDAVAACRAAGWQVGLSDPLGCSDIPAEPVDLLYGFDVIEHIPEPGSFAAWAATCIRPGGFLAVTTPDMHHPLNRLLGMGSPSIKVPQHVCYYTTATLTRLFEAEFSLCTAPWDWQSARAGFVASRLIQATGVKARTHTGGPVITVPSGMRLFMLRRHDS